MTKLWLTKVSALDEERLFAGLEKKLKFKKLQDCNLIVLSAPHDGNALHELEKLGVNGFAVSDMDQAIALARLSTISWDFLILVSHDAASIMAMTSKLLHFRDLFHEIGIVIASNKFSEKDRDDAMPFFLDAALPWPATEQSLANTLLTAQSNRWINQ